MLGLLSSPPPPPEVETGSPPRGDYPPAPCMPASAVCARCYVATQFVILGAAPEELKRRPAFKRSSCSRRPRRPSAPIDRFQTHVRALMLPGRSRPKRAARCETSPLARMYEPATSPHQRFHNADVYHPLQAPRVPNRQVGRACARLGAPVLRKGLRGAR